MTRQSRRHLPRKLTFVSLMFLLHHIVTSSVVVFAATASLPPAAAAVAGGGGGSTSSIIGESALIDKETGRIFWEGGSSSTLTASVVPKLRTHFPLWLHYFRPSLMSTILILATLRLVANRLLLDENNSAQLFFVRQSSTTTTTNDIASRLLYFPSAILFALQWTVLRTPQFPSWFVGSIAVLYLLEAYMSNTRRYLSNVVSTTTTTTTTAAASQGSGMEEYLERLREVSPVVEWKVRSFHYEVRTWMAPIAVLFHIVLKFRQFLGDDRKSSSNSAASNAWQSSTRRGTHEVLSLPAWLRRKKVSEVATGTYNYQQCVDKTVVGIWKRAEHPEQVTSFAKIRLTKLLMLSDAKTRQDYFQQQGRFVTEHCQEDSMAEFSTSIHVMGYKPKVLAVRNATNFPSKFFRLEYFWLFTVLGLTVPYRLWFDSHCDEFRVSLIKETSSAESSSSSSSSSSWSASTARGWLSSWSSFRERPMHQQQEDTSSSSSSSKNHITAPQKHDDDDSSIHSPEEENQFRSFLDNLKLKATGQSRQQQQSPRPQNGDDLEQEEVMDILQSVESVENLAEEEQEEESDIQKPSSQD